MSPLYPFNEWSDVNLYFNIGKAIFNGRTLYTEAFDHKGPLIFFIYGIGYLISNTGFFGVFLLEVLGWFLLAGSAYYSARLFIAKEYAVLMALAFPLIVLTHTQQGGSAEEFILFFQAISFYLFLRFFKSGDKTHPCNYMLIHGVMSAATFLIKLNVVLFWFFPLLAIFITLLINKEYKNLLRNMLFYISGVLIVFIPVCLYLYVNGALSEAYDIYISLNRKYADVTPQYLHVRLFARLRYDSPDFIILLLGVFLFPIKNLKNRIGTISLVLTFITLFITVNLSYIYSPYYAIPYYIFGITGFIVIAQFLVKYIHLKDSLIIYSFFLLIAIFIGIKEKQYFNVDRRVIQRYEKPHELVDQFSEIIERESHPTLLNLGLDLGNGVFTKTGIIPNTRYFISPNLQYHYYPQIRDEQTKYIENKQVQFIILYEKSFNYEYFSQLPAFNEYYELVDTYTHSTHEPYHLYKLKTQ